MSPRTVLVCLVALLVAPFAEAAAPPPVRVDALGDPLPTGALARLGTIRFRLVRQPSAIAISPDGKLAAACTDNTIYLWEMPSGRPRGILRDGGYLLYSLAFSPDGRTLASTDQSSNGELRLWDVSTATSRRIVTPGEAVKFSPNGRFVAVVVPTLGLRLYEVKSGKLARTFLDRFCAGDVAFDPDGKILAYGQVDGEVVLRETEEGRIVGRLKGHRKPPHDLTFSPDGKLLLSGRAAGDSILRVWDVARRAEVKQIETEGCPSVGRFLHQGKSLLILMKGGMYLDRMDLKTSKLVRLWESGATCIHEIAVSTDGRQALLGMTDSPYVRVFDLKRDRERTPGAVHDTPVSTIAFSPDGRLVATCAQGLADAVVRVWDASSGRQVRELRGHKGKVLNVAFSPDGRTIASGSRDRTIRLWDVSTGRVAKTLAGHRGGVLALAFSCDGRTLASGSDVEDPVRRVDGKHDWPPPGGQLLFWDVRHGKALHSHSHREPRSIHHLAFVRGGRSLFVATDRLRQWDVETAALLKERQPAGWRVTVSPDGRFLASLRLPGERILLTELLTGKPLWNQVDAGSTAALAFSPDGRLLASGGADSLVTIWDVVEGKPLGKIRGHFGWITALAFSPDGRFLAVADDATQVLLWKVPVLPARPTPDKIDLARAYQDLGSEDPRKAQQAICHLAADPRRSVPFLAKRLHPACPDERRSTSRLIEQLDADDFESRENASAALAKLGRGVAARLRATLTEDRVSLEVRHRAAKLLRRFEASEPTEEERRHRRAVAALEQMDGQPARRLLLRLAGGHRDAELTRDADESLRRMALRRP